MQYVVDNYDDDRRGGADRPDGRDAGAEAPRRSSRRSAVAARRSAESEPSGSRTQAIGGAAPGVSPLGVARRRRGEEVIRAPALPGGGDLRPDHGRDRLRAGRGVDLRSSARSASTSSPTRDWAPLFKPIRQFGIWQLLNGTFLITGIAILVAVPLGLGTAVYLSEYALAAGAQDRQADPRGPRRRADGRLRLLRAHLRHPDAPPGHPQRSTSRSSTRSPPAS